MMWLEEYRWHYDYVRLAWDTGFSFGCFNQPNFDKNKLILVDVEHVIRERDIASVERHIPTIITYNLEHEQAAVLDSNFVKIFRLSQLAVEYLLFCKKYLDNTVVLLKKDMIKSSKEMQELKKYNAELETHISVLSKHNLINSFKCDKCLKVFSTEDYLNSHIRRRHSEESTQMASDSETDKLHSEIKQLKERLNTAEKLLQEKSVESEKSQKNYDKNIVADIQEKFNNFKEQVENEIANLHIQKTFYEEKYGKMFDLVIQCKNNISENQTDKNLLQNKEKIENSTQTLSNVSEEMKLENSTQTEETKKQMKFETIQNISIPDHKLNENNISETHGYIDEKIEQKINDFGETIESKVSIGLENIERHMQIFWEKLNLMESTQNNQLVSDVKKITPLSESTEKSELVKSEEVPVIKPRTKFSKPTTLPDKKESLKKAEKLQNELNKILVESKRKSLQLVADKFENNSLALDTLAIETKHTDVEVAEKSTTPIVRSSKTLLENVNSILKLRLSSNDFISDTKQVTEGTLKSALTILNRHEDAKKKVVSARDSPIKIKKSKRKSASSRKEENVIKIHYQKKTKDNKSDISLNRPQPVSIKNRSLYDTDSESDMKKFRTPYTSQTQRAVIGELKNIYTVPKSQHQDDTDSDLTSVILSIDERPDTKGVLKSFQSENSLVKKKVLFDVEDKENDINGTKATVSLEKKYDDNLSDFNYSDV